MINFKKMKKTAALIILAAVCLASPLQAENKKKSFGHIIPPFKGVFIKLFVGMVDAMSMDTLKTSSAQMSDKERAAISYYLGEDGHKEVNSQLSPEKQAYLDEKYLAHTETAPEYDFQKIFPHVLALGNNNLTIDQMKKIVEGLTPEEIASMSFYMGKEGRAVFFSEMSLDRTEIVLNNTEDWALIETGKMAYKDIRDYTCILYKTERLGSKLQDEEKILVKYREKPLSIYSKWVEYKDNPWAGREALYNEKIIGTGLVRVKEKGILGIIPVTLPVDHAIAKRGTNHMVVELGLKFLLQLIEENYRKGIKAGELQRVNHGIVDLDGHKVFKTETILPKDESKGYYCYRMYHYIDYIRSLEIKAEVYNWDNEIFEIYYYDQININPGLTEHDFDPENTDYGLD